jgi:hypothetical protein
MKRAVLFAVLIAAAALTVRSVPASSTAWPRQGASRDGGRLQAEQPSRGVRLQADQQQSALQPTPRLANGKPDLTGVYQASNRRGRDWDAQVPGDAPGQPAQSAQPSAAVNTAQREPIPFRPEALKLAQEILNRRSIDDPAAHCLPQSSPRMTPVSLFPIEFVHTPTKLVILYEYFWAFRSIPIGGSHPDDAEPTFLGDSVARWEGDTLVVDVTHFKAGGWLGNGLVHSDALHLVERYTRVDRDQMNYEVLIDDPKVLTKPFTQRNTLMLREGTRLREYSCVENNLDPKLYEKILVDPEKFLRKPEIAR